MDQANNNRQRSSRLHVLFHRPSYHEPAIDGIRAFAILWVLILHILFFHFGTFPLQVGALLKHRLTAWIGRGDLGVDMFFVISGFLIGTILMKEYRKSKTIRMRRFYFRRFLRLIPVYAVVMLMGVYFLRNIPKLAILADIDPSGNVENAWANLLYVNNLLTVREQYMGWCWSLAIEEQFYLIAPIFLLLLLSRSRHPVRWMVLLFACSGILRLGIILSYGFTYPFSGSPDTDEWVLRFDVIYDKLHVRYGGLLAGLVGAYLSLHHAEQIKRWLGTPVRASVCLLAAAIPIWWIANTSRSSDWYNTVPVLVGQLVQAYQRDVFSISVLLVILVAIHGQGFFSDATRRVLSARLLYPVAQLSYSMYLVHEMYMLWLFPKTAPWLTARGFSPASVILLDGLLVTAMTIVTAGILYILIERPCMDLRQSKMFGKRLASPSTSMQPATSE